MSVKPRNRKEIFLNALADGKAPNIEPRTREEKFLMEQAQRESKGTSWNDLEDKPFSVTTEMVEILPKQSVTGEETIIDSAETVGYNAIINRIVIEPNINYAVMVNGTRVAVDVIEYESGGENFCCIEKYNEAGERIIYIDFYDSTTSIVGWHNKFGETITLAIYEEQEVVEKLDPKFVGKVVLYAVGTNEDPYLYHDEALSEKVTKSELFSMNGNVLVYADFSGEGLNYRYFSPTAYAYDREYGVAYFDYSNL